MPHFDRIIFGGSFDPPHMGHLALMEYVLKKEYCLHLDIVPALQSPLKDEVPLASSEDRIAMLEMMKEELVRHRNIDVNRISIQAIELNRKGPSYTIETLQQLENTYPHQSLALLVGSDILENIHLWYKVESLLEQYTFLVYKRFSNKETTTDTENIKQLKNKYKIKKLELLQDTPLLPYSSTEVRKYISENKKPLLLACIWEYIQGKRLYSYTPKEK